MDATRPPAYAWDWFARQRLLWREVRGRLAALPGPTADRYGLVSAKGDVVGRLRDDFPADPLVRQHVLAAVASTAFLDRIDRPFAALGLRNAPRGLRWWWTAITGEELATPTRAAPPALPEQLRLSDVATGYGDAPHPS